MNYERAVKQLSGELEQETLDTLNGRISILESEKSQIIEVVRELAGALAFYGDEVNYVRKQDGVRSAISEKARDKTLIKDKYVAGKRAREALTKHADLIKQLKQERGE